MAYRYDDLLHALQLAAESSIQPPHDESCARAFRAIVNLTRERDQALAARDEARATLRQACGLMLAVHESHGVLSKITTRAYGAPRGEPVAELIAAFLDSDAARAALSPKAM